MRRKLVSHHFWIILAGLVLFGGSATAQTRAYRQTDLGSDVQGLANNLVLFMQNSWGIAFQPGQAFFIANARTGSVTALDATGSDIGLGGFVVPNVAGTGGDSITGIVADPNSIFGNPSFRTPFILVTESGNVFEWGPDVRGDLPQQATLVLNHSASGAVYTGVAILNPPCCNPFLAVANFHSGFIETYTSGFALLAPPGSFDDPGLPAGYAPYGIQVVGSQVFVTYALQDAAKQNPVPGVGNGLVNIFDLEGNFVKRFVQGGQLQAPWGVTQASANFGPFSSLILIGNTVDGAINAFDPASGNFVGAITDGDGNVIRDLGLHALTFRTDGFGDPDTLYITAGIGGGLDGVFAALKSGLVSTTNVSAQAPASGTTFTFMATVAPSQGNTGTPTGTVTFIDSGLKLGSSPLGNGAASFTSTLAGVGQHQILAQYSGDATFLPSSFSTNVQVGLATTTVTLTAPANAAPGTPVNLVGTVNSPAGTPTGQVTFNDGGTVLGMAPLSTAGVATLSVTMLAAGSHSLTASYAGDGTFGPSTSSAATIMIVSKDFTLGATPPTATVIAGQSATFLLTVTPAGGFADAVNFSCSSVAGITCSFSPATVTPANGAASTMLTVSTSASVSHYGLMPVNLTGPGALLAALTLFSLLNWRGSRLPIGRKPLLGATGVLVVCALSLGLGGCGGYSSNSGRGQTNRGVVSVMVTAQSGSVLHAATVTVTVE